LICRTNSVNLGAVREAIHEHASKGSPSIHGTAMRLGLSRRSLQRFLALRGYRYTDLLDDARFELSCRLLQDSTQNIAVIGRRLGYRDPSSFSRAFCRWAGCSPRLYRANLRA